MNSSDYRDPSREYPPSRPTFRMLLMAMIVAAAAAVLVNWPRVSSAAHVRQIESSIAQAIGL